MRVWDGEGVSLHHGTDLGPHAVGGFERSQSWGGSSPPYPPSNWQLETDTLECLQGAGDRVLASSWRVYLQTTLVGRMGRAEAVRMRLPHKELRLCHVGHGGCDIGVRQEGWWRPDTLSHAFPIGASMLPGSEGVYTGTPTVTKVL